MAKKVWSHQRNAELLDLHRTGTFSTSEIAERLKVSPPTIYSHLRKMGLATTHLPRRYRGPGKQDFTNEEKQRIGELRAEGSFITKIARDLGRTHGPTRRVFSEMGLTTSNFRETRIGERFGYLVVSRVLEPEMTYKGHKESRSLLLCHCGREVVVYNYNLRSGNTRTCGCKIHLHRAHAPYVRLLHQYIGGAKTRGLEQKLDVLQVKLLVHRPCFYCGDQHSNTLKGRRRGRTTHNGLLPYTGIDRVDTRKGYVPGNVLPCCETCNRAKSDSSVKDFAAWLRRLGRDISEQSIHAAATHIADELGAATNSPLFL